MDQDLPGKPLDSYRIFKFRSVQIWGIVAGQEILNIDPGNDLSAEFLLLLHLGKKYCLENQEDLQQHINRVRWYRILLAQYLALPSEEKEKYLPPEQPEVWEIIKLDEGRTWFLDALSVKATTQVYMTLLQSIQKVVGEEIEFSPGFRGIEKHPQFASSVISELINNHLYIRLDRKLRNSQMSRAVYANMSEDEKQANKNRVREAIGQVPISDEEFGEILGLYLDGTSIKDICFMFPQHKETTINHLIYPNTDFRQKRYFTEDEKIEMIRLNHEEGLTYVEIADIFDTVRGVVSKILLYRNANLPLYRIDWQEVIVKVEEIISTAYSWEDLSLILKDKYDIEISRRYLTEKLGASHSHLLGQNIERQKRETQLAEILSQAGILPDGRYNIRGAAIEKIMGVSSSFIARYCKDNNINLLRPLYQKPSRRKIHPTQE